MDKKEYMTTYRNKNKIKIKIYQKKYNKIYNKERKIDKKLKDREYYLKNREKIIEQTKLYKKNNKDKVKIWRDKNKSKIKKQSKKYRKEHKNIINERNREYNRKHKDKRAKYKTTYYEKNKDIVIEKQRKYAIKNKEKIRKRAYVYIRTPKGKYFYYKNQAKRDKRKFTLTFSEFMKYWQQNCYYCSNPIETIGLDRINNKKGYIKNNVVSCCYGCNTWKHTLNQEEFYNKIKQIYENIKEL